MSSFLYNLGRKTGKAMRKPKWYYKSFFGDPSEAIQAENVFGYELAEQMKLEFTLLNRSEADEFINKTASLLTERVKNADRKFTFIAVQSSDINAFAIPGGYIFLTSGILELCGNKPDRLAMILGHEIVHVVSRHPLKKILTNKSLSVLANMLKTGSLAGQMAKKTLESLIESSYSQENEFHADQYGLQLMVSCGFCGDEGINALKELQRHTKSNDSFNYFSTHPSISERVQRLQRELRKFENL